MSLRQKVKLELADGTDVEVIYDGRDLRAWESTFGRSALIEDMSLSMLTWLGWHAGKREGLLNGAYTKYEALDAACTSVQGMKDEEPDRPPTKARRKASTRSDPGDASSAP